MGRDIIVRTLTIIIQIFIVATIVFSAIRFMPGDPAVLVLGTEKGADIEAVTEMRKTLGLDQPFFSQYIDWMKGAVTLDFGQSIFSGTDVTESIMERLPKTLELAFLAMVMAILIGVPLGIIAALKRGSIADSIVSTLAAVGISFPVYIMGTFLILLLSFKLNLLPASGYVSFSDNPIEHFQKMALPALTLSLGLASTIARMTRSSMLEVLNKDFIQTLRAKGLSENKVIVKHAFRNAIIAIITVIGLELGNLIGGTVLIEYMFNYPGLSSMLIQSINDRDYPLIQGSIVFIATLYILINLFIEILYGVMDPRTRKQ